MFLLCHESVKSVRNSTQTKPIVKRKRCKTGHEKHKMFFTNFLSILFISSRTLSISTTFQKCTVHLLFLNMTTEEGPAFLYNAATESIILSKAHAYPLYFSKKRPVIYNFRLRLSNGTQTLKTLRKSSLFKLLKRLQCFAIVVDFQWEKTISISPKLSGIFRQFDKKILDGLISLSESILNSLI